jgi:hypothetical protein
MTFVSCSGRRLDRDMTSVASCHRGDLEVREVIREAKLLGFLILLAAIFIGAHAAGARLGPVTTSHSRISYPGQGGGMNMGGMNMGGTGTGQDTAPMVKLRGGRR